MSRTSTTKQLRHLVPVLGMAVLLSGCQTSNRQGLPRAEVSQLTPVESTPINREAAKPVLPDPAPAPWIVEQPQARIVTTPDGESMLQPAIPVMEALGAVSACAQSESNVARALRQMKPENIDRAAPNFERIVAAHTKFLQTAASKIDSVRNDPVLLAQWTQIQAPSEADAPRVAALLEQSRLSTEPLVSESLLAAVQKVLESPQATAVRPAIQQLREAYLAAPASVVTAERRQALIEALGDSRTELPAAMP